MSSSQPSPPESPAAEPSVPTVMRLLRINTSRKAIFTINGVEVVLGGIISRGRFQLAVITPEGCSVRHEKAPVVPRREKPAAVVSEQAHVALLGESPDES